MAFVEGTTDDDSLVGTIFTDTIFAYEGDDTVHGLLSNDLITGDEGDDKLFGDDGNDTLNGGEGFDYISGGAGDDILFGGNDADGAIEDDTLVGGDGADELNGGHRGANWYFGGSGADTINGQADAHDIASYELVTNGAGVEVDLAAGVTTQDGFGSQDTLSNVEEVRGSIFADSIRGSTGSETLLGGDGSDTLWAGGGGDSISGGRGRDLLLGRDDGVGNALDPLLAVGGEGNDTLCSGAGDDGLLGGRGIDEVSYRLATPGVHVDLALQGEYQVTNFGQDFLFQVENLSGSAYGDRLFGSDEANLIYGDDGDDSIDARGGDDWLRGSSGTDRLDGGDGLDLVDYSRTGKNVHVALGKIIDTGAFGIQVLLNIEDVLSGRGDDQLTGDGARNSFISGAGRDTLTGNGGDDFLNGADDADVLSGGAGVDYLYGGLGIDSLRGGGGGDRFVFQTAAESAAGAADTIEDFNSVAGDRIDLTYVYAGTLTYIGSDGFHGTAGEVRVVTLGSGDQRVGVDLDGDAKADMQVMVTGGGVTGAGDIFL